MNQKTGPEPDNYTMEEMMERLRQNSSSSSSPGSDAPELVTRADGTQMMRVRRRKRRSRQKHKEKELRQRKMRMWQIICGFFLVVGMGSTALGMLWYFNSRPYLTKTVERLSHATGAKTELQQFRMNPIGASALTAKFTWPEGSALRSLEGAHLHAPLLPSSFVLSKWQGEEMSLKSAHVKLAEPVAKSPSTYPSKGGGGFSYQFERYVCEKLTIDFGAELPPILRYLDGAGSLRRQGDGVQVRIEGGKWQIADWLPLDVDRGMFEVQGNQILVHGLNLRSGAGKAHIEGELLANRSSQVTLKLSTDALPGEILMGAPLASIFKTQVTGEGTIMIPPAPGEGYRVSLSFHDAFNHTTTSLNGLPFMEILKKELQDLRFGRVEFNSESAGTIVRDLDGTRIEGLRLTAGGLLAVQGDLAADRKGQLSGQLQVGIDERLFLVQDNKALKAVFTESKDGFLWAPLRVSGDVQHPQDDLAAKIQATGHKLGEPVAPAKAPEQEFFDLINHR